MTNPEKQELTNGQKIRITFALIIVFLLFPALITGYLLHLCALYTIVVALLPFISLGICLLHTGGLSGSVKKKLTLIKYNPFCPLLFYYDPTPDKYHFKQCADLEKIVQPGDILLRRHKNYLDSLVLGQASFFTHAGIYYGDHYPFQSQVLHVTGDKGVSFISLAEFSRCDDILVLRMNDKKDSNKSSITGDHWYKLSFQALNIDDELSNDASLQEAFKKIKKTAITRDNKTILTDKKQKVPPLHPKVEIEGSIYDDKIIYIDDFRALFLQELKDYSPEVREAAKKELRIYDAIVETLPNTTISSKIYREQYVDAIKSIALAEYGKPYDYSFNFTDYSCLSCVEFVWFAYKCLYPLHAVDRGYFRYFYWIKPFVIVPDSFIKSRFFEVIYVGIHKGRKKIDWLSKDENGKLLTKKKVLLFVASNKTNFFLFCLKIIIWELALLAAIKLIVTIV